MEELYTLCQSTKTTRWADLLEHLEWFAAYERLSVGDRSRLVEDVGARIATWGVDERAASEQWMYDMITEDTWEYGVNGVYSDEYFQGFATEPYWLFPLAASVTIANRHADLCDDRLVAQFKMLDCWRNIRHLSIAVPVNDDCRKFLSTDSRFSQIKNVEIRGNEGG